MDDHVCMTMTAIRLLPLLLLLRNTKDKRDTATKDMPHRNADKTDRVCHLIQFNCPSTSGSLYASSFHSGTGVLRMTNELMTND